MTERIDWSFNVGVAGGPGLNGQGKLWVEVYDKTSVSIPAGDSAVVDILPAVSDKIALVIITASDYGAAPDQISYKQDATDTEPITLDAPLTLLGSGAASMFKKKVNKLTFSNGTDKDVDIQILVGRNA